MVGTDGVIIYIIYSLFQMLVLGIYFKEMFGFKRPACYMLPLWVVHELIRNLWVIDMQNVSMNMILLPTINILDWMIMAHFLCNGSWKKKIILISVFFLTMMLIEPFLTIVIVEFGISTAVGIRGNYMLVYFIYFMEVLCQLVMVQIISILFKDRLHRAAGNRHWIGVMTISISSLVACTIQMIQVAETDNFSWQNTVIVIIYACINFVGYYFFMMGEEKTRMEMESKLYEEQVKMYGQWMEGQKQTQRKMEAYRHDVKNHISALKGLCDKYEQERKVEGFREINEYLNSIGTNYGILKNEVNSGNVLLDTILNMKINYAISKGIIVEREVTVPKDWRYDSLDMVIVLGNLLDNAIEACQQCLDGSERKLRIDVKYDKGNLFVNIQNTYPGGLNGVSGTLEEGRFPKTTKDDRKSHGIGMKNIADVIQKYDGIMRWQAEAECFHTEVLLYGVEDRQILQKNG